MLRSFLIYLSKAGWARALVMRWSFAWRAASRFVAGEKLEDGIRAIRALNSKGINATLDHLGEHVDTPEEARRAVQDILRAIDAIQEAGVSANVSIKLTQIGYRLGTDICADNLRTILEYARERGNFIRIDMEESDWVDQTLDLYHEMKTCCLDNTGVVIQSYLYRSEKDVRAIVADGGRIRLCKGAYKEPPDRAFPVKADVDANYVKLMHAYLSGDTGAYLGIATHDEKIIDTARAFIRAEAIPGDRFEFQMLYGIRSELQRTLVREGYKMRVYVPVGTQWYPYFMRRLAERPANLWFFVSNFFRA